MGSVHRNAKCEYIYTHTPTNVCTCTFMCNNFVCVNAYVLQFAEGQPGRLGVRCGLGSGLSPPAMDAVTGAFCALLALILLLLVLWPGPATSSSTFAYKVRKRIACLRSLGEGKSLATEIFIFSSRVLRATCASGLAALYGRNASSCIPGSAPSLGLLFPTRPMARRHLTAHWAYRRHRKKTAASKESGDVHAPRASKKFDIMAGPQARSNPCGANYKPCLALASTSPKTAGRFEYFEYTILP